MKGTVTRDLRIKVFPFPSAPLRYRGVIVIITRGDATVYRKVTKRKEYLGKIILDNNTNVFRAIGKWIHKITSKQKSRDTVPLSLYLGEEIQLATALPCQLLRDKQHKIKGTFV